MTARPLPPVLGVTGGVTGMAASYAAVRALADRYDEVGDRLRDRAAADAQVLVEPDLLASAVLSPVTFAEAEARVLAAAGGVHGATEASVCYEADAILVRATVAAFEASDRLVAGALATLDHSLGFGVGVTMATSAPSLLALGLVAGPPLAEAWHRLPPEVRRRLDGEVGGEVIGAETRAEEWLDEHPEATQHAVDGTGGLLDGLLAGSPYLLPGLRGIAPFHASAADAAADLALLYAPEGPPHLRRRPDLAVRLGPHPPDDLAGLVRHLAETNALSPAERPGDQGTIEVQTWQADDGTVRHVVYLPGTDDLTTTPTGENSDVRDLPADLHLVADQDTTYARGIEQAMTDAGIGPRDPVLLVGHSLGGMAAASLLAHGCGFSVTHVVTLGSPVAGIHGYPPGSHVLSLENRGDVVPLLDGRDNADSVAQVTVRFDDHETAPVANHDLGHYVRGAAALDISTDPAVREQLDSLRAQGFLGSGGRATSQVLQITR